MTEINIKGMVCDRCIFTIRQVLQSAGYQIRAISLGKVVFYKPIEAEEKSHLKSLLGELGFELISDKNERLLAEIKEAIEEWRKSGEELSKKVKLSDYLSEKLNRGYDSLSHFFAHTEGKTIERYFISRRIEKVKELLKYTNLSLTEIAFETGFSSAHHLSAQFKKTTGLNPSALRALKAENQRYIPGGTQITV
jgi:AraC family transcriptional regulator